MGSERSRTPGCSCSALWPQRLTNAEQEGVSQRCIQLNRRGGRYRTRGRGAGKEHVKVQLHRHRCVLFSFLCKNLGCFSCFLKQKASKERTCCRTTGGTGPDGAGRGGAALSAGRGAARAASSGPPGAGRRREGLLPFRMKASKSMPQSTGQAGWTSELTGVERGSLSAGRPGGWTVRRPGQRLRPCSPPLSLPEA